MLASAVVGSLICVDMWLFVFPKDDGATEADLTVILGPWNNGPRLNVARALAERSDGKSQILVSVYDEAHECGYIKGVLASQQVTCFRPRPFTTRGEAREAASFALSRGLRSVTIVTSKDQLLRARVRFRRCVAGDVRLAAVETPLITRLRLLPYQNAAMVKALIFERAC